MFFSMMLDIFAKFYREHFFISVAVLLILIYLFVRKSKTFFLVLFISALLIVVLSLWMYLFAEQNSILWK